jgi:putative pyruvate formate lyase activating enzyme
LAQVEYGEEPEISPSYMIYMNGCNMKCEECQQAEWMRKEPTGGYLRYDRIVRDIRSNATGLRSISFLGGNPDQSILTVFEILKRLGALSRGIPIVWNSNLTGSAELMRRLNEFVDVFLPDFKYGSDKCASRAGSFPYLQTIRRNLLAIDQSKTLIIRHRPRRGHLQCCTKNIIQFLTSLNRPFSLSLIESLFSDNSRERKTTAKMAEQHGIRCA